jgi:8-oxo-dGTP pyrophosphatase MutT (NUDIX family)
MPTAPELFAQFRRPPPKKKGGQDLTIRLRDADEELIRKKLLARLKRRWSTEDDGEALRSALFTGLLEDYVLESSGAEVQTLVRSMSDGTDTRVTMPEFLGVAQPAPAPPQWRKPDPDELTRTFLAVTYKKSTGDFALPQPLKEFSANMQGTVRALACIRSVTPIEAPCIPDTHPFVTKDGQVVRVVEPDGTGKVRLAKERRHRFMHPKSTGVNDVAGFIWCNLSMQQVCTMSGDELIKELGIAFDPLEGTMTFKGVLGWDDVAIEALKRKVRERKLDVVGPLKLSANALIVDPERASLVIQKKRDDNKKDPYAVFGGGFQTGDTDKSDSYVVGDSGSIVRCVRREVYEESNLSLPLDKGAPFDRIPAMLLLQTHPGFIQVCFLGWRASSEEVEECLRLKRERGPNTEGGPRLLPMSIHSPLAREVGRFSVAEQLKNWHLNVKTQWRPAGLLAIYSWYRLGCPGATETQRDQLIREMESQT